MPFIHPGLLLLTCLLGCSQLINCFSVRLHHKWCRFSLCAIKGDFSSKQQRSMSMRTSKVYSPPRDNPHTQPCRPALSALPSPRGYTQSQGSIWLSGNPRCKLWYTTYSYLTSPIAKEQEQLFSSFFHFLQGVGLRTSNFNYDPSII